MARSLSRIRSLISEINEIQNQGRAKTRSMPGIPPLSAVPASPAETASAAIPGRIALSLSQNVVLEVRVDSTPSGAAGEIVEIRKAPHGLEIFFQDGKAFHIPFKDVA